MALVRKAIGLNEVVPVVALSSPAQRLNSEVLRSPMLAVALVGAGVNLLVLWQVRRLTPETCCQLAYQASFGSKAQCVDSPVGY